MEKSTTAQRLREIMDERNLRQVDVLNLCKPYCKMFDVRLDKSHLSQYLSGRIIPKQDKLSVLGYALGVSEAWLMGFDVDRKPTNRVHVVHNLSPQEELLIEETRRLNNEGHDLLMKYLEYLDMQYKK